MKTILVDFETFYGDGYTLSLKNMTTEAYIRDKRFKAHGAGIKINNHPSHWVSGKDLPKVFKALDIPNNILVGHNLQFDGSILAWKYGIYPKLYIDTLALSRALVGPHSTRHGLTYIAELLCGMRKMDGLAQTYNVRDLTPEQERILATYCISAPHMDDVTTKNTDGTPGRLHTLVAGDTELTYGILKRMLPWFPKSELVSLDWTIRAFTDPKLRLDTRMLVDYRNELAIAKEEALVNAGLTDRKMLMSNPQFAAALEALGVEVPTKISGKTGKVGYAFAKTDSGLLELLEHPDPQVQALVAARLEHKSTIEETRAALYQEASERGAWPVGYNYAGATVTQRYSGNRGGGGNPQNLKRGGTLRRAIYAPEPFVLGVADLSQIEARITLWLGMQIAGPDSEEAKALKVMAEGGDIYGWFGTRIYGKPINKHDTPLERQIAKSAVLGLGFGMGAERFIAYCKQSGIKDVTQEFAEHIVSLYRDTFKGVRAFWRQCTKAINGMIMGVYEQPLPANGLMLVHTVQDPLFSQPAIRLPNGLCIKYPGLSKTTEGEVNYLDGSKIVKLFGGKITENIVQAVAAEIMREQKTEMLKHYWVVMTTHDELICMVPEEDDDVKKWDEINGKYNVTQKGVFTLTAEEIMCKPISYLPGLPMGIETGTAYRYGDAKN